MNEFVLARIENLQQRLIAESMPALLVTDVANVTYLSGFTGDASYLLVTPDRVLMLSDTRFTQQLLEECPGLETEIRGAGRTTLELAVSAIGSFRLTTLAIEADSITRSLSDQLEKELTTTKVVPTSGWVEVLRAIKDASELKKIRHSIDVNECAFRTVLGRLHGKMSEREIAFDLENEMRKLGADRCAFSPIVGVGARAALPHARLTHRTVGESPFVLIDWGAFVDGYASDLTRTLVTGEPPAEFLKIYDVVLRAQQAAIDLIRPGADLQTVDTAARKLIADEGYGDFFGHGLGHGFGLVVHEQPFMTPTRKGVFREGMVVTVEPGIYLPNVAGVRIEDDILVTSDGHESLSTLPRDIESQYVSLV